MADDIDDLLDEVESKYVNKKTKPAEQLPNHLVKQSENGVAKNGPIKPEKSKKDSDLDALIDDICDLPEPLESNANDKQKSFYGAADEQPSGNSATRKCLSVYIGGSQVPTGMTTTANQRACERLRCTDCDFKVTVFDDFKWETSVDYLFLRNNMPDFDRLKSKLIPRKGYRAYACQCKWQSVKDLTDIGKERDVKWVCAKHI